MNFVIYLALGFVFFVSSFIFIRRFLRVTLAAKYENIEKLEEAATTVSMRSVSVIQATMTCSVALFTVLTCEDVMWDVSPLLIPYLSFGVAYMLYDVVAMFLTFQLQRPSMTGSILLQLKLFLKERWLITVHHLAVVIVGFPIVSYFRNGKGDFFMGCLMFTEFSTPFFSFRYIILKMQWNVPTLKLTNDILFMVTFFICRILLFPYMFSAYARYKQISIMQVPGSIPLKCNIACLLILVLQLKWFHLIVLAAIRRARSSNVKADKVRVQSSVETGCNHVEKEK